MIYTARQLEDFWKQSGSNGQLILPYRARLSPMAADWIKSKRITLGYSDTQPSTASSNIPPPPHSPTPPSSFLYWCDGPCGTAKAALMAQSRESSLAELPIPSDPSKLLPAIKHLATEIKSAKTTGGILLVQAGASAIVYANRCPSLRAILGTCLETVEQGIQHVAANVLILEYPHKTLQQVRNLLSRFVKANRTLSDETKRALQELATCA